MSRPRVLVVRSGLNPFFSREASPKVEIIERVSHRIEDVEPGPGVLDGPFELAVFTSQIAVRRIAGDSLRRNALARALSAGRVAAIGEATAQALAEAGLPAQITAGGSARDVLAQLPTTLEGWRVLLPCGEDASDELPEGLRERRARVESVVVYRKIPLAPDRGLPSEILERPFAAFCATSPSAARWLFEGLPPAAADRIRSTPAVVLGRFTRRFLEAHGVARITVADEPRFAAAMQLLEELAAAPAGA